MSSRALILCDKRDAEIAKSLRAALAERGDATALAAGAHTARYGITGAAAGACSLYGSSLNGVILPQ